MPKEKPEYENRCPICGRYAFPPVDDLPCTPNEIVFCISCENFLTFNENLELLSMSEEEINDALSKDEQEAMKECFHDVWTYFKAMIDYLDEQ